MNPSFPAVLGALLLGAPLSAQSLQGRILDRAGLADSPEGQGVAGAKLVLYDAAGKKVAVKAASRTGAYRFPKLAPGKYTLTAEKKDFLPSPSIRVITVMRGDTLARNLYLERPPLRNGTAVREAGPSKRGRPGYYQRLALGILEAVKQPAFYREAADAPIGLGRFYDAEDTTEGYRRLWSELVWAEIESQGRPVETRVFLAHALDSARRESAWPAAASMARYLKVSPDSVEALTRAARAMILSPSRKTAPESLLKFGVPKGLVLSLLEGHLLSPAIPPARKKAFLARGRKAFGAGATRRLAAKMDAQRRSLKKGKAKPPGIPRADGEALWKVVLEQAGGKRPNPVALYHASLRRLEQGNAREALAGLKRLGNLRSGYAPALMAEARCALALDDTAAAQGLFDSLARLESPDWQARGFHGMARLHWKAGRAEEAERALWRAMGMDAKSDSARQGLFLLAEISLQRGTWSSVESHLDSLVRGRPWEAEGHYWLGRMALKEKKENAAMDSFRKAAALSPARADFAAALAEVHFAREEYDQALRILRPMRARLSGEGLTVYGECLLIKGKPREAVQEFKRLHAARPTARSLVQLAKALTAAGLTEQASAALEGSPFLSDPHVRMALAEAKLARDAPDEARRLLEPLAADRETDAGWHFLLGRCAFVQRDYAGASREFTAALQYREDYPDAKFHQGLCLLKQSRNGEAHHYFQELVDSDRRSWRAKGLLGNGQAFAQENKPEAAWESLIRSYQESPTGESAAHLAFACLRLEKLEEASGWADKARKMDAEHPLALMAEVDVLLARKEEHEALTQALAGLDRHPESCDFLMVAAKANLQSGNDLEAREFSLRARDRCPQEPAPHFYLGSLSARESRKDEAKRHFAAYLESGGDVKRVPERFR